MTSNAHPDSPAGDDQQLMRRHRDGDPRARATLIERYLPLAHRLARRYQGRGEPLDDLVQVASLGLVKAVDRWEPGRALAFTSYATPTIIGELRRYFRDATWMVRPPRDLAELMLAIERARQPLRAAIGREPAADDFAAHLGRSPAKITQAMQAGGSRRPCSLDHEAYEDGPAPGASGAVLAVVDHAYEAAEARAGFESMVSDLDPRSRDVLTMRFRDDLLQREIAARIGCSQINVSRIIRQSLERIAA